MNARFENLVKNYEAVFRGGSFEVFRELAIAYYQQELGSLFDKYYTNVGLGVSLPPGWMPIYIDAARSMEKIAKSMGYSFSVAQVKQKFGELRVYIESLEKNETAHSALCTVLQSAGSLCAKTCEYCGRPGELGGDTWIRVTCGAHHGR